MIALFQFAASRTEGRPLILDGKQAMIAMVDHRVSNPSLALRVFDLSKLFYVPLIVAIGGGLIT